MTTLDDIKQIYELSDNQIFVFVNHKNLKEVYLTFNILKDPQSKIKYPNTIGVHRKKQTNTLYTLNAMNCIIKEENGGNLDKTFQVDWELYRNSLIITTDIGYKIIELDLIDVVKF